MEPRCKYPYRIYFWVITSVLTGHRHKTRWRMTEEEAARYPGAVKVEEGALEIKGPSGKSY